MSPAVLMPARLLFVHFPPRTVKRPAALNPRDPRDAACQYLARQAELYPRLQADEPATDGLEPRDAALARAIVRAAMNRWLTLEHLVGLTLDRPIRELEPKLRAVLMAGTAQLLLLDRVPDHAAIDQSVEWAKGNIRPGAGGMVNAILRRMARLRGERGHRPWTDSRDEVLLADGRALCLIDAVLPADKEERLSVVASCPRALIDRWRTAFGQEQARAIALHGLSTPPIVVHGPGPDARDRSRLVPHERPHHAVFTAPPETLASFLSEHPTLWVQDPGSSRAVEAYQGPAPALMVDLCAGRGTKSRQLLERFPGAQLIASDPDQSRLADLRTLAARHPRVRVTEPRQVPSLASSKADLVLLDVPCSNTGVLGRRVEARYRFDAEQLGRLIDLQREIVTAGAGLLAPGGRLLYSTCSLEQEENLAQAQWAARTHNLRLLASEQTLPHGLPWEEPRVYHNGSFWALLEKA